MEINYYRQNNAQGYDEAWKTCQFTSHTDLSQFTVKPLVSINGQPYLRQHHVTYLTGRETCRAHHFAKLLTINVLSQHQLFTAITTSKLSHDVNNSLTLPTHPQPVAACPVGGGSAAVIPFGNQPCQTHDIPCNNTAFCK